MIGLGGVGIGGLPATRSSPAAAATDSRAAWPQFKRTLRNNAALPDATAGIGATERWQFAASDVIFSSAAVGDETVYVGSRDGTLYALSRGDGTVRWEFDTGGRVASSPAVVDGTVYVGAGDRAVVGIERQTGTERWRHGVDGRVLSSPAVVDGTVYVEDFSGAVYALATADGSERWSVSTGDGGFSSPAVVDDTVYVGSQDSHVYALATADGSERWRAATEGTVDSSPAVVDGTVYIGSDDQSVYALSADTGERRWRVETGGRVFSTPTVHDETVYVGSYGGAVYALAATTGEEVWRFDTEGPVVSSPVVVGDAVLVGSDDGHLYALETTEGTERWRFDTGAAVQSTPTYVDGTVLIGNDDGRGYALDIDHPPTIDIEVTPETPRPGESVRFTATVADPDDGQTPQFEWDLTGDGTVDETGSTVTRSFPNPGTYSVRLLIVVDGTQVATTTRQVEVRRPVTTTPTPPAPANAGSDAFFADVPGGIAGVGLGGLAALAGGAVAWARWSARGGDTQPGANGPSSPDDPSSASTTASHRSSTPSVSSTATSDVDHGADTQTYQTTGAPPTDVPRAPDVAVSYEVLDIGERIGAGGNADVRKAVASVDGTEYPLALKRPRFDGTVDSDIVDRFLREAETWDRLDDHENIVGVVDWGTSPSPWIALEYMDGGDLGDRSGDLSVPQSLWTALSIVHGVRHAHEYGVAHLDLKPANILFRETPGDQWDVPKVGDWGLAKLLLQHSASIDQLSPRYAAPEQFDADTYGTPDKQTDIYQLGAVFYELFVGDPPVTGSGADIMYEVLEGDIVPPTGRRPDLPPALDDVLMTAMSMQKADRHESVLYLRDELADVYESLSVTRE